MWRDAGEAALLTLAAYGHQWVLVLAQWICIGCVLLGEQIWQWPGIAEWLAGIPCTILALWMAARMLAEVDRYRQAR